jgi:heat shock protein HslJ
MKNAYYPLVISVAGLTALFSGAAHAAQPTSAEFGNATYAGIYEHELTLENGRWEGEPYVSGGAARPSVGLVEDFQLSGDLDGDGAAEQAVVLWENAGGTGTQIYLAVMGRTDGKLVNLSTARIGDRVQLRAGRIKDGNIELDVIQQGPDEPACCPSRKVTRTWSLAGKDLQEGRAVATGKLSLADLEGVEWVLSRIRFDEALSAGQELTLRIDGERISGRSACNRYFAGITESADMAGDISIGPIGSTRMACPEPAMALERRYFAALEGTHNFSFLGGKLVLNWTQGDQMDAMLFMSREPQSQ